MSKKKFYLPFYFQHMQWRPCTVLNFTTPIDSFACHSLMDTHGTTVHQNPWKGVQQHGQLSRVNGTIKMQQALNIQINAKSYPFPNLLFFLQKCGHQKAATDPRTQVQQLPSYKKWFHFSPWVCDFQPPCRSHAHLFERDNLHRTTRFSNLRWKSQPEGGR